MKTLITLIAALSIGGVGGWTLNNEINPTAKNQADHTYNTESSMPAAVDFVSLRPSLAALPAESLSEIELAGLRYTREEEKLARDVYTTLYEQWGLQIFSNIAQSEQTHTEAVRDLLVKYKVTDPVIDDSVGVFVNPDLQTLYDDLVAQGTTSLLDALAVGLTIEELDIRDLEVEINNTDNADITLVYENLLRGSRNHLRSFMTQLANRGGEYQPQYISQAELDKIISSAKETGAMNRSGRR